MGISLSTGVPPPDDVLINVSSTNKIQLKPGTQGDILYAGASGTWAKLAAGTSAQYLKSGGAAADPAWTAPPGEGWTLVETLSPSAVTTITTASMPAYNRYMIVINNLLGSGADNLAVRVNGSSGAIYHYISRTAATLASVTSATYAAILNLNTTPGMSGKWEGDGITPAAGAGSLIEWFGNAGGARGLTALEWEWQGGNAVQLTTFTFFSVGAAVTFTGKIEIYGRNV